PNVVNVMLQLPVPSTGLIVPVQVSPLASFTVIVTLPVTCGAPATALSTLKLMVTTSAVCDGSGLSAVIVVVLLFLCELNVHAENCVTPESSAQLFVVSTAPVRPSRTHAAPSRKSPNWFSTLPFNSESR